MVVYKDVNACKSFANLSINNQEVSKLMCRQNLSTDRQTEVETLCDSEMLPSQHFICRGIIKVFMWQKPKPFMSVNFHFNRGTCILETTQPECFSITFIPFYLNKPLDKLCECRQCILVMHLLDDEYGQRGLVPVQLLTPRVWNGPEANISISYTCMYITKHWNLQ